jgi:hypothetical protein
VPLLFNDYASSNFVKRLQNKLLGNFGVSFGAINFDYLR